MQLTQYAEVLADDQREARERERMALEKSIALMERARAEHAGPADAALAVAFTTKLWTVLVADLAEPGNGLPKELRAQIVSIGIWILKELEAIRNDPERPFDDVITVCKAIREGLL